MTSKAEEKERDVTDVVTAPQDEVAAADTPTAAEAPSDEPAAEYDPIGTAEADEAVADDDVFTISRTFINYTLVAGIFLLLGVIAGVLIAGNGGGGLSEEEVRAIAQEEIGSYVAQGQRPARPENINAADYADDDPFLGPVDAPVTIVEFSDFRCGFCARHVAQVMPRLLEDYDGYIRYVFRDFPAQGQIAVEAAIAGECAGEQDLFWPFHNTMFANQGQMSPEFFRVTVQDLGADMDAFNNCYENRTPLSEIQEDYNAARAVGTSGTPTFLIGTQYLIGAQPYEEFARVIDEELEKAGVERSDVPGTVNEG